MCWQHVIHAICFFMLHPALLASLESLFERKPCFSKCSNCLNNRIMLLYLSGEGNKRIAFPLLC